jgi:lantibiotic modifying enzyme
LAAGAAALIPMPVFGLPKRAANPYEDCAKDAVKWLRSSGFVTGAGKAWCAIPGDKTTLTADLYSGTAGVALLLAEASRRWNEPALAEEARLAGKEVRTWLEPLARNGYLGLYTGYAGCVWVLSELEKRGIRDSAWSGDAAPDLVYTFANELAEKREATGVNDVISGLAGLGLAFLEKPLARDAELSVAAACGIGDRLLDRARKASVGLSWAMAEGAERELPNFSHGTAGVAFFLAKLYGAVRRKPYLEAAIAGADYLKSIANPDGLVHHSDPDGLTRYYLGWCHGPAGTAQLWLQLHKATGKSEWRDLAVKGAQALTSLGVPEKRAEGYWNNEGLCCGTAGIGRFFLDMYRRTGEKPHLQAAEKCAGVILEKAVRDGAGARWSFAEHRVKPQEVAAQTGWMQGAAGIAAFLMEMSSPRRAVFRLPVDAA